jgi:chromosome segregation ATPase
MDSNQLAKMIEWLDEERRRDKQTIAILQERLSHQTEMIESLQRRLTGIESDQTVIKESSVPIERERELLEQLRIEMRQVVETSESRRLNAEREAERRHELNREGLQRTIRDLQEQVDRLNRNTGKLTEVKSEGSRMLDTVSSLQQRVEDLNKLLEEPERRLAFLEEQRRLDVRRIAELESEIPELRKQLDSVRPKVTLIEDLSIRNERRIQEIQNTERERREQIQQFVDQQNLVTQQRDQRIEELTRRFSQYDEAMSQNLERFETWASAYRDMKRIIDDFERIGDRLERRINEVAEMQRLSEERFRQEWNDWRDDDQKRWKQLTLSNDEVWRNHDKEFEQWVNSLDNINKAIEPLADSIKRLWNLERDRAQMYRERYQALLLEYDVNGTRPSSVSTASSALNTGTSSLNNAG